MSPPDSPDPCTMMSLASIAYSPLFMISDQVKALGQEVVWGPAELGLIPYSAAFIAYDSVAQAYTVVIRGTDPLSWSSWKGEDFDLLPTVPFSQFTSLAPSGAVISAGTANGLRDLLKLQAGKPKTGILGFLQANPPPTLYVTGHSLGGTLTPALFAYLNAELYGGVCADNMAPCSFAGLTPGNAAFNSWFGGLFSSTAEWRFYNTLDFAPYCWWSLADVQDVYTPWNLAYGKPESDLLDPLFASSASVGFAQPAGGYALQGTFNESILDQTWVTQAIYQHHHTTYQALVNAVFCPG